MKTPDRILAEKLLQINAIKLQPESPFIWASGWNSPIYTDNRRLLSYPDVRNLVKIEFSRVILENFPNAEAIAGVATGAIAIGAIVADTMGLPYAYVRSTPKDHGLENTIEGNLKPGQKVVVIEELVSTGGSSLKVVDAIRNAGCEVEGMVTLFTFEFPEATKRFRENDVTLISLTNYTSMIETALASGYIHQDYVEALCDWRKDPANWTPNLNNETTNE